MQNFLKENILTLIFVLFQFLAIFAFSCATGYRGHPKIVQTVTIGQNTKTHTGEATIQYPFDQGITMNLFNGTNTVSLNLNFINKIEKA